MSECACTPGQTVGPFFDLGLPYPGDSDLVGEAAPARRPAPRHGLRRRRRRRSGRPGRALAARRRRPHPAPARFAAPRRRRTFTGWGRCATDAAGRYAFTTVAPGSASAGRPPFFALTVFARGLLDRLFTRAYLPDGDLGADPLLASLDAERRATVLCVAESGCRRIPFRHPPAGPARDRVPGVPGRWAMTNLLWPGDHRAGEHMTDRALLESMVAVESAWLRALSAAGLAPAECADADLSNLLGHNDCEPLAVTAEDGGNPVIGLVALLRQRAVAGHRAVDPSRTHQPGRPGHRPDARRARRRRSSS